MEDDHNRRRPQLKMTSMEDNLYGRRPQWEKFFQWRITSMEEDLKEVLQEDDISLFSKPILYRAWSSSAPACSFLMSSLLVSY